MDELISELVQPAKSKIVLLVLDGLGGFRNAERGSELFEAKTPNLDQLASDGSSGLHTVVGPGVTPGSGAGHLALFGYDPLVYRMGRGALCAAGLGFDLGPLDIAARLNFCTLDDDGNVSDRRAGRISTEVNQRLCDLITQKVDLGERAQLILQPEMDHRALLVLRAEGLSPHVSDTDPQAVGLAPKTPIALAHEAEFTATLLHEMLGQIRTVLKGEQGNFVLMRGFDTLRNLPRFPTVFRLRSLGIAVYPMYTGIARILGMEVAQGMKSWDEQLTNLESNWDGYDFFYIHDKKPDSAGEDGSFERKCAAIEEIDKSIPRLMDLNPDVICVTGDHCTPSFLKGHSWHPVPFLLRGPAVGVDTVTHFNEEEGRHGAFGHVMAKSLMPLMLASAGRLAKFGA